MTAGTVPDERGQDKKVVHLQNWADRHHKPFYPKDPSILLRRWSLEQGVKKEDFPDLAENPKVWNEIMNLVEGFDIQSFLQVTQIDDELGRRIAELYELADKLFAEVVLARLKQVTPR